MTDRKIALVAITVNGARHAGRLAQALPEAKVFVAEKVVDHVAECGDRVASYTGSVKAQVAALMAGYDQIVFFVSLGAVVRLLAPHLKSKEEDPGVVVVDDAARYAIPLLSGHQGGANAFAREVAGLLEAEAVITTASDVGNTLAVDILGRALGWRVEAPKINLIRLSAHVVNREPVAFVQEAGEDGWWDRSKPLPENITLFATFEEVDHEKFSGLLWVTHRDIPASIWEKLKERLVVYRPPGVAP